MCPVVPQQIPSCPRNALAVAPQRCNWHSAHGETYGVPQHVAGMSMQAPNPLGQRSGNQGLQPPTSLNICARQCLHFGALKCKSEQTEFSALPRCILYRPDPTCSGEAVVYVFWPLEYICCSQKPLTYILYCRVDHLQYVSISMSYYAYYQNFLIITPTSTSLQPQ